MPGLLGLRGVWAEVRRFAPGLFGLERGVCRRLAPLAPGTGGNGSGKRDSGAGHRRNRRPVVVRTGRMVYNKK